MPNNFNFTESGYTPDSYDFNFSPGYFMYNILSGVGDNFVAIWADPVANLDTAKVYVGSSISFFVIDLEKKALYDTYTLSKKGSFGESLDQENIVDINVGQ